MHSVFAKQSKQKKKKVRKRTKRWKAEGGVLFNKKVDAPIKMLARSTRIKKKKKACVRPQSMHEYPKKKKEAYVLLCMLSILSRPPRIIVGTAIAHQQKCYFPFLSLSLRVYV